MFLQSFTHNDDTYFLVHNTDDDSRSVINENEEIIFRIDKDLRVTDITGTEIGIGRLGDSGWIFEEYATEFSLLTGEYSTESSEIAFIKHLLSCTE